MRQFVFIALVMAALVACGRQEQAAPAPEAQQIQPFDLHIEIGRYGYMLSQVHRIANPDGEEIASESPEEPRALARALRETAWEYNLERSRLCARAYLAEASCGPSYNPVWLADPADAAVSLEDLQARANALGEVVTPFWNAVCEDARSKITDEEEQRLVCAIE
jgi:nitrous oxide reductase accessory protein NosL